LCSANPTRTKHAGVEEKKINTRSKESWRKKQRPNQKMRKKKKKKKTRQQQGSLQKGAHWVSHSTKTGGGGNMGVRNEKGTTGRGAGNPHGKACRGVCLVTKGSEKSKSHGFHGA